MPASCSEFNLASGPGDTIPDFEHIEWGMCEQVGQNLRTARSQLGFNQSAFAALIGVSRSQYRRYEAGRELPRLHSAIVWSVETGIPTQWLFSGTGYHKWIDIPLRPSWIPILHFVNRAPEFALRSFQAALEGLVATAQQNPLVCHTTPSIGECRRYIDERYFQVISEKLREFRSTYNLSQEAIAHMLGVSSVTYKRYEMPDKCIRFSINLIMRFWSSTNVNPLALTRDTPLYQYRQKQNHNFSILLPLLGKVPEEKLESLKRLVHALWPIFERNSFARTRGAASPCYPLPRIDE